jgi:hypothetical protein
MEKPDKWINRCMWFCFAMIVAFAFFFLILDARSKKWYQIYYVLAYLPAWILMMKVNRLKGSNLALLAICFLWVTIMMANAYDLSWATMPSLEVWTMIIALSISAFVFPIFLFNDWTYSLQDLGPDGAIYQVVNILRRDKIILRKPGINRNLSITIPKFSGATRFLRVIEISPGKRCLIVWG